jgi:long-chain fatty acid transport protein
MIRVIPAPVRAAALVAVVGLSVLPPAARSAGYGIYEQGARALGMAGAFTALADDPSALFFNPAGVGRLEGTQVTAGLHLIRIEREFAGEPAFPGYGVTEEGTADLGTPVNAYLTHRLADSWGLGVGLNNPFGLKVGWEDPEAFTGRFVSREASLTPFFLTGALAWNATPGLSVAAGPVWSTASVGLERNIGANNPFYGDARFPGAAQLLDLGHADIEGNGTGWGWTAGILARFDGGYRVGATFRSAMDIDYDGDADFTYDFDGSGNAALDAVLGPTLQAGFPGDQDVAVTLPFPASAVLGFAFDPAEHWTVAVDAVWTGWSRLGAVGLTFDDPDLDTRIVEDWDDVVALRAGTEWRAAPAWSWRAGAYFDPSPQPTGSVDPLLPDADRVGLSLGAGIGDGPFHLDAYGLVLLVGDRSTRGQSRRGYDGTYASGALIGGANVTWRFGRGDP